ncbi:MULTISPECIES: hypothetical protein [unclassified Oceanispirochaeta]|uniref:hypothetical protein n=1 Tax=unclassified Oceanispirochaeta TaxID=2635722 RepID=UPI000E096808|nr:MULTISPECIES: hypothetical protein [unclassified Oceanispirochaeta]MBF9017935.1 hypothetical protein [Oceanispirochaeta sp. M2]NPD74446.1 hypothetical protein [Oceanispirochaeta sp. M1]RDG29747.1 hypothetical protein DV872_20295 [Oceanispirochaeta sp. M1]
MNKKNLPLFILLILFFSSLPVFAEYPSFKGGAVLRDSLKIENDGSAYNLADELGFTVEVAFTEYSRFAARLELNPLKGYNAAWTDSPSGFFELEDDFNRTMFYLESDVLQESGLNPSVPLNLKFGYGSSQEVLRFEHTRYRFEHSTTSGIDGFNFRTRLQFGENYYLTAAVNPASFSFEDISVPDCFGAFYLENDHRGISWGSLIHFTSSSMQLFYDSHSNLENNRIYSDPDSAMTLGIGGTLLLSFAGIDIFGFGMTEYFLMYDRDSDDIMQAEWAAGFEIPLLAGMTANLSGSNGMILSSTGEGSFMNFGLDVQSMMNKYFGLIGAVAGLGILDSPGLSYEAGFCLELGPFSLYSGYSDHNTGAPAAYTKGAFDKTEILGDEVIGGGFFLSIEAEY